MDHAEKVDQDAVLRARTTLLASDGPSVAEQVEAYRVLSVVSPLTYVPKLAEALVSYGYEREVRDLPEVRMARFAEGAAVARLVDASVPRRTDVLLRALSACRRELYAAGRRAEGFTVCEEMAEVGRWGYEHGQANSPACGYLSLAVALAEEGRHGEAAELCGEMVEAERGTPGGVSFWTTVQWAAELDAAGRHDAALEGFAELVRTTRAEVDAESSPLVLLTYELTHQAGMLDAAGRRGEARAARQEALELLAELDRTGERRDRGRLQAWWVTLFALSGRSAAPAPSPEAPAPAFGTDPLQWSPDIRNAYFDGLRPLEAQVAAAREDVSVPLPELITLDRGLTIRTALHCLERAQRDVTPLRPAFDEGVALARRLGEREVLGRALSDRAMFLLASGRRYDEAHDGLREACVVWDG